MRSAAAAGNAPASASARAERRSFFIVVSPGAWANGGCYALPSGDNNEEAPMFHRMSILAAAALVAGCTLPTAPPAPLERVRTLVVIYAENHSFDNMYGMFPGADGVANATDEQKTQLDHDGKPLPALPSVYNN